jgi:hypothetical protein
MALDVNLIIGVNFIFETSRAEGYMDVLLPFWMPSWNFYTSTPVQRIYLGAVPYLLTSK